MQSAQRLLTKNEWRVTHDFVHKKAHGAYKFKDEDLRSGMKKLSSLLISESNHLVQ